ncbi:hypothetical protein DS843_25065 [Roseomonas genomospecies 6]|uniref:Uncharacterized protein n=1 Tax=Roseomonas genomospecies 6 TaxID=214106 RepID=A0A9W7NFD2_9PROT|nr:hypothetical protein DS843_25065 [Roseomonas genomospecies 6]
MYSGIALRALLVPPTALFFSLFGLIWHGTKIGYFVLWLKTGNARLRRHVGISLAAVTALCLCAFLADNRITRLPIYPTLLAGVKEGAPCVGWAEAKALDWVVRSQGVVWPVTEWVRRTLFFGITFGYHPERRNQGS